MSLSWLSERLAKGTSNAHMQGARATWVGFAGFSVLAFSVAFVLVAVLYGQPARYPRRSACERCGRR